MMTMIYGYIGAGDGGVDVVDGVGDDQCQNIDNRHHSNGVT